MQLCIGVVLKIRVLELNVHGDYKITKMTCANFPHLTLPFQIFKDKNKGQKMALVGCNLLEIAAFTFTNFLDYFL